MNNTFKIVAAIGAALVVIGVFSPIMNAPFVGGIPLIRLSSDGYIMMVLAVLGGCLSLINWRWVGLIMGILIAANLVYIFVQIQDRINSITQGSANNEFAKALSSSVSPGMGFAIIGLGTLLFLISPSFFKKPVVNLGSNQRLRKAYRTISR